MLRRNKLSQTLKPFYPVYNATTLGHTKASFINNQPILFSTKHHYSSSLWHRTKPYITNCDFSTIAITAFAGYLLYQTYQNIQRKIILKSISINESDNETAPSPKMEVTCPENQLIQFSQGELIKYVHQKYPKMGFQDGVCYALTMMWYIYALLGKDLIRELNEIVYAFETDKELNKEQEILLQDISIIQKQFGTLYVSRSSQDKIRIATSLFHRTLYFSSAMQITDYIKCHLFSESTYNQSRRDAIARAVEDAIANPGKLMLINVDRLLVGHVIGLVAVTQGEDIVVKIFDSNYSEGVIVNNAAYATDKLLALANKYKDTMPVISVEKVKIEINLDGSWQQMNNSNASKKLLEGPLAKQKIILLSGPGYTNNYKLLKMEKALSVQNPHADIVRIGDGIDPLTNRDIKKLLGEIKTSEGRVFLYINANVGVNAKPKETRQSDMSLFGQDGTVSSRHTLNLKGGHRLTNSMELFSAIADNLSGKPIDIFSMACYGGSVNALIKAILPEGSTYVSLASKKQVISGNDTNRFMTTLIENENLFFNSNISAERLLNIYLTKVQPNNSTPRVISSTSFGSFKNKLNLRLGKAFNEDEKEKIHAKLGQYVDSFTLHTAMKQIEEGYVSGYYYGVALAVCHVASQVISLEIKETINRRSAR